MSDQENPWLHHETKGGYDIYYRLMSSDGTKLWTATKSGAVMPGPFTGGYFSKSYVYRRLGLHYEG